MVWPSVIVNVATVSAGVSFTGVTVIANVPVTVANPSLKLKTNESLVDSHPVVDISNEQNPGPAA